MCIAVITGNSVKLVDKNCATSPTASDQWLATNRQVLNHEMVEAKGREGLYDPPGSRFGFQIFLGWDG